MSSLFQETDEGQLYEDDQCWNCDETTTEASTRSGTTDSDSSPTVTKDNTKSNNHDCTYRKTKVYSKDSGTFSPSAWENENETIYFQFRDEYVPLVYHPTVSREAAYLAIASKPFLTWAAKTGRKFGSNRIDCRQVEIQSVDFDMSMGCRVDMIKIRVDAVLVDEEENYGDNVKMKKADKLKCKGNRRISREIPKDLNHSYSKDISGTFCLRNNSVGLLVEFVCIDDQSSWSLLVDHPSMAIGAISALELPTGYIDDEDGDTIHGEIMRDIEDMCQIKVSVGSTINLGKKAYESHSLHNEIGTCPSVNGSSEFVKMLYLRKEITKRELRKMMRKFSQQREENHTKLKTLRAVPLDDLWKISADSKVCNALFFLEKARPMLELLLVEEQEKQFEEDFRVVDKENSRKSLGTKHQHQLRRQDPQQGGEHNGIRNKWSMLSNSMRNVTSKTLNGASMM